MVAVSRTFTVDQPVEKVVDYLADFANARDWDPGTLSCVREDTGPLRVGSQWVNTSAFMGRRTVLTYRLETLEPRHLVFQGKNESATSRDDLRFAEVPRGTEITYRAEIAFAGALRVLSPLLRLPFERLADRVVAQMTHVIGAL